jgi:hypothetical protein
MIWLVFIVTNFPSFVHTYFYLVSHDNCHYLGLKFVKACNMGMAACKRILRLGTG